MEKKTKKKRHTGLIAAVVIFALIFAAVIAARVNSRNTASRSSNTSVKVKKGSISDTVEGSGNIEVSDTHDVRALTGLKVTKVYKKAGDVVKENDKLAKISQASITEQLVYADDALDSVNDELDSDGLTANEKDNLLYKKSALKKARKVLKSLKDDPYLYADKDGVIEAVNVSEGSEISQTSSLTSGSTSDLGSISDYSSIASAYGMAFTYDEDDVQEESADASGAYLDNADVSGRSAGAVYLSDVSTENTGRIITVSDTDSSNDSGETSSDNSTSGNNTSGNNTSGNTSDNQNSNNNSSNNNSSNNSSSNGNTPSMEDLQNMINGMNGGSSSGGSSNSSDSISSGSSSSASGVNPYSDSSLINGISGLNGYSGLGDYSGAADTSGLSGSYDLSGVSGSTYEPVYAAAFTIDLSDTVKIVLSIDELDILSLSEGMPADVTVDAIGDDQVFTGEISSISSLGETGSGDTKYDVEIELPMDDNMRLGMTAHATITIGESDDTLVIPMDALQQKGDTTYVYTSEDADGQLSGEQEVETGLSDGEQVEILSGLSDGDTVYYKSTETENYGFYMQSNGMNSTGGSDTGAQDSTDTGTQGSNGTGIYSENTTGAGQ